MAACQMTGYTEEELLHMTIRDFLAPESLKEGFRLLKTMKTNGYAQGDIIGCRKNGNRYWVSLVSVRIDDNTYISFCKDITDRKQAEENFRYQSYHDYLTGLNNRRFFDEETKRLNQEDRMPLSVIIGDINGVKLINDAFGYAEGDKLIVLTANIIQSCLRKTDVLARTGGDEFSILLPETDSDSACEILNKIQIACSAFNTKNSNKVFYLSISFGCGTKESISEDFKKVIKSAEDHMYMNKLLDHKSSHSTSVSTIKAAMLEKSQETEEHGERLAVMARKLGTALNLSQINLDKLELLATLHDIGKVGINEQLLLKPGKLSEDEWIEMKKHPQIGYRIAMASPELVPIAEFILCHQEHWDGNGYPQGLSGTSIPLLSRITAIVDAYDAMTTDRPYRKAMSTKQALAEIETNSGTQFDPEIASLFVKMIKKGGI